jgi:hypothetical protein
MTERGRELEGSSSVASTDDPLGIRRTPLSRRQVFRIGGQAAVLATTFGLLRQSTSGGQPPRLRPVLDVTGNIVERQLVATDGWVSMPAGAAPRAPVWPDPFVPVGRKGDLYVFGFADATRSPLKTWEQLASQENHANLCAPLLHFDEGDDVRITVTNLGLKQRPDLLDAHTLHWHGFPNQIPYFDGVPQASLSVPVGRNLVYRFIPQNPGTYMYHCHVEDVEHVHMGLVGIVFIRPKLNRNPPSGSAFTKFVYNEPSTGYDREFAFILSEADVTDHWNDAHAQENDFTDWSPTFFLMNGRGYPDTLDGNGPQYTDSGSFTTTDPRLVDQPWSSLVQANAGETVLLRFSNLGFQEHSMELPGVPLRVVGKDAKQLTSSSGYERPGYITGTRADISYTTDRVELGPGESRDVLFKAPNVSTPTTFDFFDRNYGFSKASGKGPGVYGGMRTEVRVYPTGTLPSQAHPHQLYQA